MGEELSALTTIFTEFYYWLTVAVMFLIHLGFLMYEVGASRYKNHLHTMMKNVMLIPLVTITFYFFGWWIYFAFQNGPGITGGLISAPHAVPWSEVMGTHLGGPAATEQAEGVDTGLWARLNGVFWAAFLLFSWTAASIVSGACIERIRYFSFYILAVLIGSVFWIIDAAWGWSSGGWMVKLLGYHDAYASGVIHAVAGGFGLGVLIHLGPRIGKFRKDGTPRDIVPHNPWLAAVGIFAIFTGFWGFYVACNVPIIEGSAIGMKEGTWTATNIYLGPTTLSAITFNFLMSLSGGFLGGYFISKADPFWTFSGGLAGLIAASAGNDLYNPMQSMLIGVVGAMFAYKMHFWVERKFKIDDPVGAVAVHGYAGFLGLVICGFMLWGYPASPLEGFAHVNPLGNFVGAIIMFGVLGLLPGWIFAGILKWFGVLRVPDSVEIAGLDIKEMDYAQECDTDLRQGIEEEARSRGKI